MIRLCTFWLKRIAAGLLILWFGAISPLIYMESYSSHEKVLAYRVTLLQETNRLQKLQQILPALFKPELIATHESSPARLRQPIAQTGSQFFLALVYEGAVPGDRASIEEEPALNARLLDSRQASYSVSLPPPDKPPTFQTG